MEPPSASRGWQKLVTIDIERLLTSINEGSAPGRPSLATGIDKLGVHHQRR
jgi:hypothetical protein